MRRLLATLPRFAVALDGHVTRAGVLVSVKGNFPGNGRAST